MATSNLIFQTLQDQQRMVNAIIAQGQKKTNLPALLGGNVPNVPRFSDGVLHAQLHQQSPPPPVPLVPLARMGSTSRSPRRASPNTTARAEPPTAFTTPTRNTNAPGTAAAPAAMLQHPNDSELNTQMSQAALHLRESYKEDAGTKKALDPKIQEFTEFCNIVYGHRPHRQMLMADSVYRFMWHQTFRKAKPRGGRRKPANEPQFNHDEHKKIMKAFKPPESASAPVFPQLEEGESPVGPSTVSQCKATFRKIWKCQLTCRASSLQWHETWNDNCVNLEQLVLERAPKHQKESCAEKWKGEFAPCAMVAECGDMELEFWKDGSSQTSGQNVAAHLRHRYCFSHLTSGTLRCESLCRAELSDFIMVHSPKRGTDVHAMMIMVNQIMFGKTNHGRKLHGRAARHREVAKCCIGALAFFLMHRFFITREFANFTVDDWLDNKKWFRVKPLVSTETADAAKPMKKDSDSCGKHAKRVLNRLKLFCNKILHLGRNLGAKLLEMLEEDMDEIRRLGNWNPSIFDRSCSAKLPLSPIRKLAGFHDDKKHCCLPRGEVEPSDDLKRSTPIGWVYDACDAVLERCADGSHPTAIHFLRFLKDINEVFLQDAAEMHVLHEGRRRHPLFEDLDCLNSPEFEEFKEEMKQALERKEEPTDAKFEQCVPGLHQRQQATFDGVAETKSEVKQLGNLMANGFQLMHQNFQVSQQDMIWSRQEVAKSFSHVGQALISGQPVAVAPATPVDFTHEMPNLNFDNGGISASTNSPLASTSPVHNSPPSTPADHPGSPDLQQTPNQQEQPAATETVSPPKPSSPPAPQRRILPSPLEHQPRQPPPIQTTSVNPPITATHTSISQSTLSQDLPKLRFANEHSSLSDPWDEWFGIGECSEQCGGFHGRDQRFGKKDTSWRKHLGQNFGRTKRAIEAIQKFKEINRLASDRDAIAALEPLFVRCNCVVQKMVSACQDMNPPLLIKQKSRGRKKKDVSSQQQSECLQWKR